MAYGKVVKTLRKVDSPGRCASCGKVFSNKFNLNNPKVGYKVLIQCDGITEPYDLCNECADKAEQERVIEV